MGLARLYSELCSRSFRDSSVSEDWAVKGGFLKGVKLSHSYGWPLVIRGAGAGSVVYLWAQRQGWFAEGSWVVLMGELKGIRDRKHEEGPPGKALDVGVMSPYREK